MCICLLCILIIVLLLRTRFISFLGCFFVSTCCSSFMFCLMRFLIFWCAFSSSLFKLSCTFCLQFACVQYSFLARYCFTFTFLFFFVLGFPCLVINCFNIFSSLSYSYAFCYIKFMLSYVHVIEFPSDFRMYFIVLYRSLFCCWSRFIWLIIFLILLFIFFYLVSCSFLVWCCLCHFISFLCLLFSLLPSFGL
jgi:hypothetical protein